MIVCVWMLMSFRQCCTVPVLLLKVAAPSIAPVLIDTCLCEERRVELDGEHIYAQFKSEMSYKTWNRIMR